MNILAIIGARPQFIKHVSFLKYQDLKFSIKTLHTGQHFDQNMSNVFFDDFDIAKPEFNLSISGGSHGEQTGKMIIEIEKVILSEKPKAVLLYGDTNSTLPSSFILHLPFPLPSIFLVLVFPKQFDFQAFLRIVHEVSVAFLPNGALARICMDCHRDGRPSLKQSSSQLAHFALDESGQISSARKR